MKCMILCLFTGCWWYSYLDRSLFHRNIHQAFHWPANSVLQVARGSAYESKGPELWCRDLPGNCLLQDGEKERVGGREERRKVDRERKERGRKERREGERRWVRLFSLLSWTPPRHSTCCVWWFYSICSTRQSIVAWMPSGRWCHLGMRSCTYVLSVCLSSCLFVTVSLSSQYCM